MEPLSRIITALVAGARAGASAAVNDEIRDAYHALKLRIRRKLAANVAAGAVLDEIDTMVDTERMTALRAALAAASFDEADSEAARALQRLLAAHAAMARSPCREAHALPYVPTRSWRKCAVVGVAVVASLAAYDFWGHKGRLFLCDLAAGLTMCRAHVAEEDRGRLVPTRAGRGG